MNERMRKMTVSMASVLVTVLIVCVLIMPKAYLTPVAAVTLVVWAAMFYYRYQQEKRLQQKEQRKMQVIDLEPDYKKLFGQQVYFRVQERIKDKFPGASVEICAVELQNIARSGKPIYVALKKAGGYTHISVALGRNGDINMNLFSLVNFDAVANTTIEKVLTEQADDGIEEWFNQKGQQLLTELVTNMNTRGYSKLWINEQGEVLVKENGRNVVKDYFKEVPPKKHWAKLKELMEEDGLQVNTTSKHLTFAW